MSVVVEHITVRFGAHTILDDVSCEARPGRVTGITGPNAAGKSTLVRTILGVERPSRGGVTIGGLNVRRMSPRTLAGRVAYVAQRPRVTSAFTVREVVELGRYALSPDEARIDRAIALLELEHLTHRPFHVLSVGQQQRVMVARALAQLSDNGVLLLDEPTSAMDLEHVTRTINTLRACAGKGATVVAVLHDLTLLADVCDDVWLLDAGRLVAQGPPDDVLTPGVLEPVFHVPFARLTGLTGKPFLVVDSRPSDPPVE